MGLLGVSDYLRMLRYLYVRGRERKELFRAELKICTSNGEILSADRTPMKKLREENGLPCSLRHDEMQDLSSQENGTGSLLCLFQL